MHPGLEVIVSCSLIFDSFFVQIGICCLFDCFCFPPFLLPLLFLLLPSLHLYEKQTKKRRLPPVRFPPLLLTPTHTHYWYHIHTQAHTHKIFLSFALLTRQTHKRTRQSHTYTHSDSQTRPFLGCSPHNLISTLPSSSLPPFHIFLPPHTQATVSHSFKSSSHLARLLLLRHFRLFLLLFFFRAKGYRDAYSFRRDWGRIHRKY